MESLSKVLLSLKGHGESKRFLINCRLAKNSAWEAMGWSALADHCEDGARLFTAVYTGRMRGNGNKLR